MKTVETFQGWSNRETWTVNLWIANDRETLEDATAAALDGAGALESWFEEWVELMEGPGGAVLGDLLTCAVARVEWVELARSLVSGFFEAEAHARDAAQAGKDDANPAWGMEEQSDEVPFLVPAGQFGLPTGVGGPGGRACPGFSHRSEVMEQLYRHIAAARRGLTFGDARAAGYGRAVKHQHVARWEGKTAECPRCGADGSMVTDGAEGFLLVGDIFTKDCGT